MHIVDIVAACVVAVVLLMCAVVLARQQFMLRASGTFPVALRLSEASRWQYGVARYAGGQLRWYRSLGLGTRPNRVLERRSAEVVGRRAVGVAESRSLPSTAVVVECRDGAQRLFLALGEGAYTGFVSWLESSAPMA